MRNLHHNHDNYNNSHSNRTSQKKSTGCSHLATTVWVWNQSRWPTLIRRRQLHHKSNRPCQPTDFAKVVCSHSTLLLKNRSVSHAGHRHVQKRLPTSRKIPPQTDPAHNNSSNLDSNNNCTGNSNSQSLCIMIRVDNHPPSVGRTTRVLTAPIMGTDPDLTCNIMINLTQAYNSMLVATPPSTWIGVMNFPTVLPSSTTTHAKPTKKAQGGDVDTRHPTEYAECATCRTSLGRANLYARHVAPCYPWSHPGGHQNTTSNLDSAPKSQSFCCRLLMASWVVAFGNRGLEASLDGRSPRCKLWRCTGPTPVIRSCGREIASSVFSTRKPTRICRSPGNSHSASEPLVLWPPTV
mmetsp:Transcript_6609/g.14547  ORF Transcript_6609/g.14547 Transcript_6609/m.14547 type:complete len:351 (+) Transcript_6609:624-1676(+)